MQWKLQEARQRFSEVVRKGLTSGPQVVTRHGRDAVVVVALDEFSRLRGAGKDFKKFLTEAPDLEALNITRDPKPAGCVRL